ncbi:MAG: IclR family transcriptional regulator [Firmicutes bacterium]|nr:IclR family transcriptional regulator [Bacillota bacterium]
MKHDNTVKSVIKALNIFKLLVEEGKPVSLSSISKKADINISTVYRLLNTLAKLGYVKQNEKELYCLGLHSYEIADLINQNFNIWGLVRPYLKEIVDKCNETSSFAVLEANKIVYIDQIESKNMVKVSTSLKTQNPAYCTGSGKILLAYLNNKMLEKYIKDTDFIKYTDSTIIDSLSLKKELNQIKKQGYATELEEKEKGVHSVAAPIFGMNNKPFGAISISGPSSRITHKYLTEKLIPLIISNAKQISAELQTV